MSRVSLVVITRNRRHLLERSLPRHLASLPEDGSASDVIVVDNASTDRTSEWLRQKEDGPTVLRLRRNAGHDARLVGAARASTPFVAFSDDDSWWEEGMLERACGLLDDQPDVGLVVGSALVGQDREPDPINSHLAQSSSPGAGTSAGGVLGFLAFAAVARRDALLTGVPFGLGIGAEESLMALDLASAGWRIAYHPELRARHVPEQTGDREGRQLAMARNSLAISLARRRGRGIALAVDRTLEALPPRQRLKALTATLEILPWVMSRRRPVPWPVERLARSVDEMARGDHRRSLLSRAAAGSSSRRERSRHDGHNRRLASVAPYLGRSPIGPHS